MRERRVIVVGGGLAGMTVAWELVRRGCQVTLLEERDRLGGKAGSNVVGDRLYDHGYHVFPGWYRNTRRLLRELGVDSHLVDIHCVHYVKAGEFPERHTLWELSSPRNLWRNLRGGLIPWPDAILASYFALDLSSTAFSHRRFLDRVSVNGFLRSRVYGTEGVATAHEAFVLQAVSTPSYEISAMTARRVTQSWFRTPSPIFSILDGSLQETLIRPFQRALEEAGVRILLGHRVVRFLVDDGTVHAALVAKDGVDAESVSADLFVLATPHEATFALADENLQAAEECRPSYPPDEKRLSDLAHLRSAPMAAMHVELRRRVPEIPPEHTVLMGSRYELSFVDISQHWKGLPHTLLSVIASDYASLRDLPESAAKAELLAELLRFLTPVIRDTDVDVARVSLFPNLTTQLFLNTVGAWSTRPNAKTRLGNLYIAGDYCRSEADLATMESAVSSALTTAERILRDLGGATAPGPLPLASWPRPLVRGLFWALYPAMLALHFGAVGWGICKRWLRSAEAPEE